MTDDLTANSFQPFLEKTFRIHLGPSSMDLTLSECQILGGRRPGARDPFSLLFHGPMQPVLPQRIYPMEHEGLGALEIFLVPIGPDAQGMRYEAVFT